MHLLNKRSPKYPDGPGANRHSDYNRKRKGREGEEGRKKLKNGSKISVTHIGVLVAHSQPILCPAQVNDFAGCPGSKLQQRKAL